MNTVLVHDIKTFTIKKIGNAVPYANSFNCCSKLGIKGNRDRTQEKLDAKQTT